MLSISRPAVGSIAAVIAALWCLPAAPARAAIVFGQVDDFENGTPMGWVEGFSPNEPTTVPTGSEQGTDDAFLRNVSSGDVGAGGKQVMFNLSQWTGNYNAAGVTRLRAWAANFGPDPIHLRVTFSGAGNQFSSTRAVELLPDGVWRPALFDLTGAAITRVTGFGTPADALANVTELRVISSVNPAHGRTVEPSNSTLGLDDLRALRTEGDANFDGAVDGADFSIARANLGRSSGVTWREGDFNFDGRVNARDMALLRRHHGESIATAAAISALPEPAAATLLIGAGLLLLRRRRHPPTPI